MNKTALITGITGQDGAYLSKYLLSKGYNVIGTYRPASSISTWRLEELGIKDELKLYPVELLEYKNIERVLEKYSPDEVYNLAAQSFVGSSFKQPLYTSKVNSLGVTRILEVIRGSDIKFYQASTSEMFGDNSNTPLSETDSFQPRSPYAISKLYAHFMTVNYRKSYGLHASSGILFNHESPLRGKQFVTRKITSGLAKIKAKQKEVLELGNLSAERDWGFAGDYVRGMHKMLQEEQGNNFVLATGDSHSVKEFVEVAASILKLDISWEGSGKNKKAINPKNGEVVVKVNEKFYRPNDVECLNGDYSKAKEIIGWEPKVSFPELVRKMVKADRDKVN